MSYIFKPIEQDEGRGARALRVIGSEHLKRLDPFILMDHFKVRLPGGFPDHPHRGFETITYMKQGSIHHQDFKGHKGTIKPGDIQWMTAGKGIVHAQMPGSKDEESIGFQLWLNLKSTDKMKEPHYQEFRNDQIPIYQKNGAKVKIICGQWQGHKGPIDYTTPSLYMDIELQKDGEFEIEIKQGWNSIIYVYEGEAVYKHGEKTLNIPELYVCVPEKSETDNKKHTVSSKNGAKFLIIGGQPLNQPLIQKAHFVMNSDEQIQQAVLDFQQAQNGFEYRKNWTSKIRELANGKTTEEL